tara:strand:- start:264 stop:638 length:375 start_codon:yes stop_codon:yes gene_type:complete
MGNSNSQIPLDEMLSQFQWKKRILLLITDEEDIKLINGVNAFFNEEMCQNKNRNLELFKIVGDEISKYKIPRKYVGKKGVWLIGYDGGDKAYSRDLSLLNQLYDIIDKMPIRLNEMANENSNCN